MGTARLLLRGSFLRNADLCASLVVAFSVTPLILHSLGHRMYGIWTLIGTVVGYYGVLDLGLSSAASRFLSQSRGKGDADDLNRVADTAFFLFCLVGCAAFAATALSALACPWFIRDPAEAALFRRIILLLGTATAIAFPVRTYLGILTSYLRFDSISLISIGRTVAANGAIYLHLRRGGGIMGLAVIVCAVSLLQSAALYAACAAQVPAVKPAFLRYEAAKIRVMFSHGWKTAVCMISTLVRFQMDSVVIAWFLGVGLVAPYAIGARLVDGFNQLVLSSVGMMLPVFSQYEGRGDSAAIRGALLTVTRFSAVLSAYVGLSLVFYGPAFIRRWVGPGFEASWGVAALLSVGYLLHLPQSPGVQLLYATSRHGSYAALNACEAALNLALSVFFVRRWGIYGVALGTAVEMFIFKLFVQPIYICRVVGLPVRTYLVDNILVPQAKAAVPLGLYFFLIRGAVRPDYERLCACVVAQTALFLPTAYCYIISADERRFVNGLAASYFAKSAIKKPAGVDAAA
jgi:O-antigen/teichoic acid export membrane protein